VGDKYLCKLGKKYLNVSLCKFVIYSLQHSETFDVFLPLSIAELSTLKQVRFFWPTLYIVRHCAFVFVQCYDISLVQTKSLWWIQHINVDIRLGTLFLLIDVILIRILIIKMFINH